MTISLSAFCHRCKQPVEDCGCVTPEQRRQLFADESESRINAFRTALYQAEAQIQELEGRLNNPCDMCLELKEIINELEARLQATRDAGIKEHEIYCPLTKTASTSAECSCNTLNHNARVQSAHDGRPT